MTHKLSLKWFLWSLIGTAALLGFMIVGQSLGPFSIMFGKLVFPESFFANVPFVTPSIMQIGGAIGIMVAVFLAYWKRLLTFAQLLVSLMIYDAMMIAYQLFLFPREGGVFDLIFNFEFLARFNAFTTLPFLIAVGICKVLRALKNR
jgi:hypothetical protein